MPTRRPHNATPQGEGQIHNGCGSSSRLSFDFQWWIQAGMSEVFTAARIERELQE